jgi:hypothetical protein
VEGSAPSETEEEPIHSFSVRRAGNVGAPAILDSLAPTFVKKVDVCTSGSTGTMDEVAAGAVGQKSPQRKKPGHGMLKPSRALGRRNGGTPVGYSGRRALRRKQCDA